MSKREKIAKIAAHIFLGLSVAGACDATLAASAVGNSSSDSSLEKCYGIAKAGMNDCGTATSSCASSATQDSQTDAFLLLPKGLCQRIVGGKLAAK